MISPNTTFSIKSARMQLYLTAAPVISHTVKIWFGSRFLAAPVNAIADPVGSQSLTAYGYIV